ncbi:MAG: hypothetical protein ACI924_000494 [Flavobacterium sp.]|jgi:hypothetical protein
MKLFYEALFYSVYKSLYRYNKNDAEIKTVIINSFYLTLTFYILPLQILMWFNYNITYSETIYFVLLTLFLIFNFIFFVNKRHSLNIIQKYKSYKKEAIFTLIGFLYSTLAISMLLLYAEFELSSIIYFIFFSLIFEGFSLYFGNKI